MASANVQVIEIDQSTRVPSFPGVYGGIVIPAKKGDTTRPTLVTSDTQFLKLFTPDEVVGIGFDLAYFSALAYLEKSNKLWVARTHNGALHSGLVMKSATSAYSNVAISTGMADPSAYVFDSAIDVAGIAQTASITVVGAGSVFDHSGTGSYIVLHDSLVSHYFWVSVTGGISTQTAPVVSGSSVAHQVAILLADTLSDIASKMQIAISAVSASFSSTSIGAAVSITNLQAGLSGVPTVVGAGMTTVVVVAGANAISQVDEVLLVYSSNQGAWGNSVGIKVINYAINPDKVKEANSFIIEVYKSSNLTSPVESFLCSRILGKKDGYGNNLYVEDVVKASNYIRVVSNPAISSDILPKNQTTVIFMARGNDGLGVTDAHMVTTSLQFSNKDDIPVTVLMDGGFATPAYGQQLDNIAASRGDCVACLSVPYSDEASSAYLTDIVDYRKMELNLNSSYSALYSPHLKISDRFNDRVIFVAPDGYAAGAISASAANFEIWYPPAGFKRGLIRVLGTRRVFSSGEMDLLYDQGINPIRFAAGRGVCIWGQKTLSSRPSALDRLNVRLLLIVIEPAIAVALEDFLFELNDSTTRSIVATMVGSYLSGIQSRRGMTEFKVVCDDSNNTAEDIGNNRMNVDIYVKPTRSIEFIPMRVIIASSGASLG